MDKRLRAPLLLSIPLWGTLLPWVYNKRDPEIASIPFFYWYQLMWIPISVLCTIAVYRGDRSRAVPAQGPPQGSAQSSDDRLAGC